MARSSMGVIFDATSNALSRIIAKREVIQCSHMKLIEFNFICPKLFHFQASAKHSLQLTSHKDFCLSVFVIQYYQGLSQRFVVIPQHKSIEWQSSQKILLLLIRFYIWNFCTLKNFILNAFIDCGRIWGTSQAYSRVFYRPILSERTLFPSPNAKGLHSGDRGLPSGSLLFTLPFRI